MAQQVPPSPPSEPRADEPPTRVWSLWGAIGYGLLLLLAAVAVAARIPTLRDALDLSRLFR